MKKTNGLILVATLLLAAPAAATTVYVCRGPDPLHIRTLCPTADTCIVVNYSTPFRACTEAIDDQSAELQESIRPPLTDAAKRSGFANDLQNDRRWRALMKVLADRWGMTPVQVRNLLRAARTDQ